MFFNKSKLCLKLFNNNKTGKTYFIFEKPKRPMPNFYAKLPVSQCQYCYFFCNILSSIFSPLQYSKGRLVLLRNCFWNM